MGERRATASAEQNDSIRELMGTGVYETTLPASLKAQTGTFRLDLGDVRESARIYLNDQLIGTAWCVPFTVDFQGTVKGGDRLRIEVTNLPANRIAAYDRRGIKWRKFNEINVVDINYKKTTYAHWSPVPSGLNTTVKLMKIKK